MLEQYRTRKLTEYAAAAEAARWQYRPVIMSAFGRVHSDAKRIVRRLAAAAAKRFGGAVASQIEDAWWRNCATLLMERACRMVEKCRPVVALPAELGGVDVDRVAPRRATVRAGDGAPGIGADGPASPVGD